MNSPTVSREKSAQVCDQCRRRKVKCDGILPACSNCTASKATCTFSTQLQRKTKRRGHDPKDEAVQELRAEITLLRKELSKQSQASSPQADQGSTSSLGAESQSTHLSFQSAPRRKATDSNRQVEKSAPGPVFRHLGRLVNPEDGVDQFAGSSTGVHFTLSAQTKYQELFSSTESFPEPVFSLYLLSRCNAASDVYKLQKMSRSMTLQQIFPQPRPHYLARVSRFLEDWSQLYPILSRKQFLDGLARIFNAVDENKDSISGSDLIVLFQLYVVLAIVANSEGDSESSQGFYSLSVELNHQVTSIGNLASLQGLLLSLIYYQETANHHLIYQTVGSIVRLAQSLGLHRHARRFRFCVGETEIRKRLWWCVYIFDVMTSLHYGLPKIINNEDDDNDLPADCDFDDITLTQLPLPLPGEPTKMSPFLSYIKLAKIFSTILKELYTTTRRRNGIQKIAQITRELQVWESLPDNTTWKQDDDGHDFPASGDDPGKDFISTWILLLSKVALIYVHRPALTFDSTEPQFKSSLAVCHKTSIAILSILEQYKGNERIFRTFPSGPNLIFQCSLLCFFHSWHQITSLNSVEPSITPENRDLNSITETAGFLLDELQHAGFSSPSSAQEEFPATVPALSQASWVLRHLSSLTTKLLSARDDASPRSTSSRIGVPNYTFPVLGDLQAQSIDSTGSIHLSPNHVGSFSNEQGLPAGLNGEIPSDFLFTHGNGLEYLNQMDESTWTFLSQMGGYSGENNSGFMNYG